MEINTGIDFETVNDEIHLTQFNYDDLTEEVIIIKKADVNKFITCLKKEATK